MLKNGASQPISHEVATNNHELYVSEIGACPRFFSNLLDAFGALNVIR
jgi:hypothetical protein